MNPDNLTPGPPSEGTVTVTVAIVAIRTAGGEVRHCQAAAEVLWKHFCARLLAWAGQRMRDHPCRWADEHDLAVSAFYSALKDLARDRCTWVVDRESLARFLGHCIRQKAIDYYRRSTKGGGPPLRADDEVLNQVPDQGPPPETDEVLQELLCHLSDGDEDLERTLVLREAGFKQEEIAAKLDLSLRTVQRMYKRLEVNFDRLLRELDEEARR